MWLVCMSDWCKWRILRVHLWIGSLLPGGAVRFEHVLVAEADMLPLESFGLCENVAVLSPLVLSWLLRQLTRMEQEARAALGARPRHEHGVRGVTFPNRVIGNNF